MGNEHGSTGNRTGEVTYEKLSKRALYCMYLAGAAGGAAILAAIGMKRQEMVASTLAHLEAVWDEYHVYEKRGADPGRREGTVQ